MKDQREVPVLPGGVWFPAPVNLYVVTCRCCKNSEKLLLQRRRDILQECEQLGTGYSSTLSCGLGMGRLAGKSSSFAVSEHWAGASIHHASHHEVGPSPSV